VNWGRRFALCSDGSVWAWGQNFGKLGIGSNSSDELSPVQVPGIQDAVSITSIRGSTFVVRRNGSLLSWGSIEDGQLGDGTTTDRAQPTTVTGIQGVADLKFSLAQVPRDASDRMATLMPYRDAISAYALTDRGQLWTWGNSESGRLGVSKAANSLTPQVVKTLPERVVQVVVEGTNGYAVATAQRERRSWFSRSGRP
jgi:alpha-tubulin suppressor-like RCC1 family protein